MKPRRVPYTSTVPLHDPSTSDSQFQPPRIGGFSSVHVETESGPLGESNAFRIERIDGSVPLRVGRSATLPAPGRACSISVTRQMPNRNPSLTSKTSVGRSWLEHSLDLENCPYGASLASPATAGTVLPFACRPLSASSSSARPAASMTRERPVTTADWKYSMEFVNVSHPFGRLEWWAEDILPSGIQDTPPG